MRLRPVDLPIGLLFAAAIVVNCYLLWNVIDGSRVVQQVIAAENRPLDCFDFYQARAINDYFYPQRQFRGDLIYFFSLFWPIWLLLSFGAALLWSRVSTGLSRLRWLPTGMMIAVIAGIVTYLPMVGNISCAIE